MPEQNPYKLFQKDVRRVKRTKLDVIIQIEILYWLMQCLAHLIGDLIFLMTRGKIGVFGTTSSPVFLEEINLVFSWTPLGKRSLCFLKIRWKKYVTFNEIQKRKAPVVLGWKVAFCIKELKKKTEKKKTEEEMKIELCLVIIYNTG